MLAEWLRPIAKAARAAVPKDFVGQITINVFKGGISNINVVQSFKEDEAK